ncbi:MAG TPA: hypothetical protein VKS01_02180 [Bryobacteraceae bacterium]|nr:hypothetical protein [Bryobacteraceae bacterium]
MCLLLAAGVFGQTAPLAPMASQLTRRACPGDPAGNVASTDCSYTMTMRFEGLWTSSLSDEALLEAAIFGGVDEIRNSPAEWGRTWSGYGYRAGSLYAQNLTKGLAEFGFGFAMRTDPRNVSYANDPAVTKPATFGRRVGHAFKDVVTVRRSKEDGNGKRWPNVPLFAGATASGLIGEFWYPDSARTNTAMAMRAGGSIATAIGSSFYTEFSPEIGRALGAIFKRRPPPLPSSTGSTGGTH